MNVAAALSLGLVAGPISAQSVVDVHGRAVEYLRVGQGTPAIVIEAGAGEGWRGWESMARSLGELTTVVAYARPGYDASEPTGGARRPERSADDLADVLDALDLTAPVVLVGHSLGGLVIDAFAGRYPDRTAGLVYVDPSHARMGEALAALDPGFWDNFRGRVEGQGESPFGLEMQGLFEVLEAGALRTPSPEGIPTAVLTSMQTTEGGPTILTPEGRAAWRSLHATYLEGTLKGTHIFTPDAGHYLHLEAPELTRAVILRVLDWARSGSG